MSASLNPDRLREELAVRGLDQRQLAHIAKVSPTTVSAAANGKPLKPGTLRKLAAALARTPEIEGLRGLVNG